MLTKYLDAMPRWLLLAAGLLMVVALGIIDCKIGDYSLLIFYTVPIFMVSWFAGRAPGMVTCVASGIARFISNVPEYNFSFLNYWNSIQDMFFFLVVGMLVYHLRRALE